MANDARSALGKLVSSLLEDDEPDYGGGEGIPRNPEAEQRSFDEEAKRTAMAHPRWAEIEDKVNAECPERGMRTSFWFWRKLSELYAQNDCSWDTFLDNPNPSSPDGVMCASCGAPNHHDDECPYGQTGR